MEEVLTGFVCVSDKLVSLTSVQWSTGDLQRIQVDINLTIQETVV